MSSRRRRTRDDEADRAFLLDALRAQPVERHGTTDEQAIDAMCSYLEKRFGPRDESK